MKISVFLQNLAILLRLPSFGQFWCDSAPRCIYGPWAISARASRRVSLLSTGWGLVGLSCRASGYGRFARFHAFESASTTGVFKREVLSIAAEAAREPAALEAALEAAEPAALEAAGAREATEAAALQAAEPAALQATEAAALEATKNAMAALNALQELGHAVLSPAEQIR